MQRNRSIPAAVVVPVLVYPDVRQAVVWLGAAFGFEERVRIGEGHRAQLAFGDGGGLIVADVRRDQQPPRADERTHTVMLRVDDVDAAHARALAQGATAVNEPTTYEYGERQSTLDDYAGHRWTLSQTVADTAPEEWGGETIGAGW
jgi:uncharacterized glyoxalase superfamily protein PhnB